LKETGKDQQPDQTRRELEIKIAHLDELMGFIKEEFANV
jgi:hypothetical protein